MRLTSGLVRNSFKLFRGPKILNSSSLLASLTNNSRAENTIRRHFAQTTGINEELIASDTSKIRLQLSREPVEKIIQTIDEGKSKIRNVAIIAHVDHGKTTLVDMLLKSSGQEILSERTMDSEELEKEKGITIIAKVTTLKYKEYTINIVDTPGHQDFGGEVERVLSMVDGVILLVCATEGTMRQTRFVLQKAIDHKLKPMVIINKVDRDTANVNDVENSIFDLFCSFNIPESYLEYETLYGSAKHGFITDNKNDIADKSKHKTMTMILDKIIENFTSPKTLETSETYQTFNMQVNQLERDNIHGLLLRGKIDSGYAEIGSTVKVFDTDKNLISTEQISRIFKSVGKIRTEQERAIAGDIVTIAGVSKAKLTNLITSSNSPKDIHAPSIEPPLMSIDIIPNNSPFAGTNGSKKMSLYDIRIRLEEETEKDLALKIECFNNKIKLLGRGDLHLGVILEKMRREGYEFQTSCPTIECKEEKGELLEPLEEIIIEIKFNYISSVLEKVMSRNGTMLDSTNLSNDYQRLKINLCSRAAIGLHSELISETNNDVKFESNLIGYQPFDKNLKKARKNMLISCAEGKVTSYAMRDLERFGVYFIKPGTRVYKGQVVGISKDLEMEINPCKEKALKNVRTTEAEEKIFLSPPKTFTIEDAITFIGEDEYLEITPMFLRIRKIELESALRKKNKK